MGPTRISRFRVILVLLAFGALLVSPVISVRAQASGTSYCSAPAGGRCTLSFNLNDGEAVLGNFSSDEFVRLFVTDPSGSVVFDSGGVVATYDFDVRANSSGNFAFIFDNHQNDVIANVTLNYTHHVPSGSSIGGSGEFSIPEFPIQPTAAVALTLLVVVSYLLVRRPIFR